MEQTFSIIKPDAVKRNLIGHINQIIEAAGLNVIASKKMYLTKQQAEIFYSVHKERPFFDSLVSYMTSWACSSSGFRGKRGCFSL